MRGCVRTRDRIAKPRWRWVRIGHAKRTSEFATWEMRLKKVIVKKPINDVGCEKATHAAAVGHAARTYALTKGSAIGQKPRVITNDDDELNINPPTPCQ